MAYLFSVAIGPAQDFIAAARRTRDLWFGSWLLSELSKAAAGEIGQDRLIFPAVSDHEDLKPNSEFNVANKILAKVDDDPRRLGESVKAAVRNRLNEIRDAAFDRLPDGSCDFDKAKAQIDDLPEVYWAAVPLDGDYAQTREQVERLLASRKNTRDFGPTGKWSGIEPKSALDGLRESVIRERSRDLLSLGIKEKEELCGVGLLKRLGKRNVRFWSVPHIAALPLILSLNPDNEAAVRKYKEALDILGIDKDAFHPLDNSPGRVFPYDGHILFEEQLKEFFDEGRKDEVRRAKVALKQLLREIAGGQSPSPYYAVLHADGDRMGEAIDAQKTDEDHKKLSRALSEFAGEARKIVSERHGSTIYTGGDDVLALVPLSEVVQCARQLADAFKNKLSDFKTTKEQAPTLSVGVGVSHQLDPLEDALNLARAAEKEAKRLEGKNALCLMVSKRSGSVTTVKGTWDGGVDERLLSFSGFHERDELPDGAAYELRRLAEDFERFESKHRVTAYQKEAARILGRKQSKRGAEKVKSEIQNDLLDRLPNDPEKIAAAVRSLADELIVARLFVNKFEWKGDVK